MLRDPNPQVGGQVCCLPAQRIIDVWVAHSRRQIAVGMRPHVARRQIAAGLSVEFFSALKTKGL